MTPDEVDKKIEFILQMQAQFEANLTRSEANIDDLRLSVADLRASTTDLRVSVGDLKVTVAGLAGVVRESIKISDDRFTRLDDRISKLAEAHVVTDRILKDLAESQKTTDERLNALISVVERHITGPDHAPRP